MNNTTLQRSISVGATCVGFYLTCYLFRQLLSVFTPEMLTAGYTKTMIAALSSGYMIAYAAGNLFNGFLGDRVKPKYMVSVGLLLAGIALCLVPVVKAQILRLELFILLGFGLSMLRGPLTKTISENMPEKHARVACMCLTAASFFGPLLAGLLVILLSWQAAFPVAGVLSLLSAVGGFLVFRRMERTGAIRPVPWEARGLRNIPAVFRLPGLPLKLLSDMMFEVVTIAVMFWAPTYMVEQLRFSDSLAGMLYSEITLVTALCPFLCIWCMKLFRDNVTGMMQGMSLLAAVLFAGMLALPGSVWSLVLFLLAMMAATVGCAAIWSVYLPSLGPTGLVSGANGVFDCLGYACSALANLLFAWVMQDFGWTGMIVTWAILCLLGAAIPLLGRIFDKPQKV